jgi:hypothetical protein
MPLKQYRSNFINEMKDTLDIKIANLYNLDQNVSYKYNVRKNSSTTLTASYDGGSFKIKPYLTYGYSTYQPFAKPPVNFFFPTSNEEQVVFHITHMLSPDINPLYRSNDSIQFNQMFSNYYAYDNGSSEAGIGLNNAMGKYAVQFKLNVADTMQGIKIYFNQVVGSINQQVIDLIVWNDAYGLPGQIIKKLEGIIPVYTNKNNEFSTYWFQTPLIINAGDFPGLIFYIGWQQSSLDNLNVGFDRYNDSHTRRFYNVTGNWEASSEIYEGSLMLRPIIGKKYPTGIAERPEVDKLSFSPNPVTNGNIIIQLPESWKNNMNGLSVNIVSATGSSVLSAEFSNPVDVSRLAPGFYMLILSDKTTGKRAAGKLVIR